MTFREEGYTFIKDMQIQGRWKNRGLTIFTLKIDTQSHDVLILFCSEADTKDEVRYARDLWKRGQEKVGRAFTLQSRTDICGRRDRGRRSLRLQGVSKKGFGQMAGDPQAKATHRRDPLVC